MNKYSLLGLFAMLSALVQADEQQTSVYMDRLGVQSSNAYFSLKEERAGACKYKLIYVPLSNEFGQAAYAALLSAKATHNELPELPIN